MKSQNVSHLQIPSLSQDIPEISFLPNYVQYLLISCVIYPPNLQHLSVALHFKNLYMSELPIVHFSLLYNAIHQTKTFRNNFQTFTLVLDFNKYPFFRYRFLPIAILHFISYLFQPYELFWYPNNKTLTTFFLHYLISFLQLRLMFSHYIPLPLFSSC